MKFKLIDTHCHLDWDDYDKDRKEVVGRALEAGIGMISIGASLKESQDAVKIAEKYDNIFATVGMHPDEIGEDFNMDKFVELAKHPKVVGIGECGLDYYRIKNNELRIMNKQKELFKTQIEVAIKVNKPLIIHCRDAHEDVLKILNSYFMIHNSKLRGVLHFFTGNFEQAKEYMELGFIFSYTGVITFTGDYDETIKKIPLEKIMVETDSPFVAPVPHRGKRNEPHYVKYVAQRIAEIKGVSFEEVAKTTTQTAIDFFGLK